jgi:hypothetical protein
MVVLSDRAESTAIATKLSDMKALQVLLVSSAEVLRVQCSDRTIQNRFHVVQQHEEGVLAKLEQAVGRSRVQCDPTPATLDFIAKFQQMMRSSELSLANKVLQYTLLKFQQIFTGLTLHEAAEALGGEIASAMKSLNGISFELEIHQEELKEILEILAVRELTGREPSYSFLHQLQDSWIGW